VPFHKACTSEDARAHIVDDLGETLIKSGISKSRFPFGSLRSLRTSLDSAELPVNGPFCSARNDKVGLNQTFLRGETPLDLRQVAGFARSGGSLLFDALQAEQECAPA